jgi:hypothetical protein
MPALAPVTSTTGPGEALRTIQSLLFLWRLEQNFIGKLPTQVRTKLPRMLALQLQTVRCSMTGQ